MCMLGKTSFDVQLQIQSVTCHFNHSNESIAIWYFPLEITGTCQIPNCVTCLLFFDGFLEKFFHDKWQKLRAKTL